MKRKIILLSIIFFVLISLTNIVKAENNLVLNMSIKENTDNLKKGDEITYTISSNESIIACNFNIKYDGSVLELIKSDTEGMFAEQKEGEIACIYADLSGQGTNEFKIKFKIKNNTKQTRT